MKSSARASRDNRKHTLNETDTDTDSQTTSSRTAPARNSDKKKNKDTVRNNTKTKKSSLTEKEPKPAAGSSSKKRSKPIESSDDEGESEVNGLHPDMDIDEVSEKAKRALFSVQQLQDELEEAEAAKERLQDKVAQLEERAQFLEASSRLNASIAAKENMDLKERARQFEIQLSTVSYERDNLKQGITFQGEEDFVSENKDEAIQLSLQLKDTWLSIRNLKTAQEAHNKELAKSQETNASLTADLTNGRDQLKAIKYELSRGKARWETDRENLEAEIRSLKGKGSGIENTEWTKIRKRAQDERAVWDQERKGFMDQIASLKVKAGSLGLQSKAPPEWVKDKQRLMDQCSALQLRLASLESDRAAGGSGSNGTTVKKLEAENQRLEKKFEETRAKLKEAMDAFKAFKAQVEDEKTKSKRKPRAVRQPVPKSRTKNTANSESESEAESEPEVTPIPMKRTTRTAAVAAVRKIGHLVESESEQDSDVSDSEDGHDDTEAMDADKPEEDKDGADSPSADEDEMEEDSDDYNPKVKEKQRQPRKNSKGGKSRKADGDDSASDFEMTEQKVGSKERKGVEKSNSLTTKQPAKKNDKNTKEPAIASEDGSESSSKPSPQPMTVSESTGSSVPSTVLNSTGQGQDTAPVEKAKKKRKLLTGKGLADLGDILLGPGSALGSEPSSGLDFSRSRLNKKSPATTTTPPSTTSTKPAQALDALQAIKMQFSIKPKPTTTTGRKEI